MCMCLYWLRCHPQPTCDPFFTFFFILFFSQTTPICVCIYRVVVMCLKMYVPRKFIRHGLHRRRRLWFSIATVLTIMFFFLVNTLSWIIFLCHWLPFLDRVRESPPLLEVKAHETHFVPTELTEWQKPPPDAEATSPLPSVARTVATNKALEFGPPNHEDYSAGQVSSNKISNSSLLYVHFTGRRQMWTLKTIMEKVGFQRGREPTVCPPLQENTTIPVDELFEVGMLREFVGGMYHPTHCRVRERYNREEPHQSPNRTVPLEIQNTCSKYAERIAREAATNAPKYAYVMMVSNHRYLDGAIVLADSIREHSPLSRSHDADIVLIINERIKEDMFPLLQVSFDRVQIFQGLQQWAANSAYKTTFEKIYLYMMEDYTGGILFLDADSLIIENPDFLLKIYENMRMASRSGDHRVGLQTHLNDLHITLQENEGKKLITKGMLPPLFAVGNDHYFQTGLLILQPSLKIFLDLYLEFRLGSYGYNRWQARDGILFRNCFTNIGKLSGRPHAVHHFTGTPKPWFNLERVDHKLGQMKIERQGHSGEQWRSYAHFYNWWARYEFLHLGSFVPIERETRMRFGRMQDEMFLQLQQMHTKRLSLSPSTHGTKYGGEALFREPTRTKPLPYGLRSRQKAANASPNEYMWLMRFSKSEEYLHPTRAHEAKLRTGAFRIASERKMELLFSSNSSKLEKRIDVYAFATLSKESAVTKEMETTWSDCDARCAQLQLQCNSSLLLDTRIADCKHSEHSGTMANGIILCKRCLPHYDEGAPFVVFGKQVGNQSWVREADVCFFNAWSRFTMPQCNASKPRVREYKMKEGDFLSPVCACQ